MEIQDLTKLERKQREIENFPLTGPEIDGAFFVFAVRVCSETSVGKRKLIAGRVYYLLEGFLIFEDRILVSKYRFHKTLYDYYLESHRKISPHISISAVVGENGAGKSSLIEFELRLINNMSAIVFGEQVKEVGGSHLHFIDGVQGELFYLIDDSIYILKVCNRTVSMTVYQKTHDEENGQYVFRQSDFIEDISSVFGPKAEEQPIIREYDHSFYQSLKPILSRFFYTVVLNQSVYAYNTNDFRHECNSEPYEIAVRQGPKTNEKGSKIPYSFEDRCWLSGLFHKNDGYQIPVVLTPCRSEGNYDINVENRLAYERLISIMVRAEDSERIINGHLRVTSFTFVPKPYNYDIEYIHKNLGYRQFTEEDFDVMIMVLLSLWSEALGFDILKNSCSYLFRKQALNYLVYKTLKIADTYDEYRDYRNTYQIKANPFDKTAFASLVQKTITNDSHVTKKLLRTIAYLVFDIYEIHKGKDDIHVIIDDIRDRWLRAFRERRVDLLSTRVGTLLLLEASIPPPFFETSIGLVDLHTHSYIPFEYLSSGEKQQAYTTSSIAYHLKNIDSVREDRSTGERVVYNYVQLILEEVELYYHPELQRSFVKNLLDGIKLASLSSIDWISICIVTHSPFVLSDIPSQNVLALHKDKNATGRIPSFGANIHEMLKLSFFLEKGTIGDFASWEISRIAQCLKVTRWINKHEQAPSFFPSLEDVPEEYSFLEGFKTILNHNHFNEEGFRMVYSPEVLLSQINLIEEPVYRRALLEEYRRTFPDNTVDYRASMRLLLESQLAAFKE